MDFNLTKFVERLIADNKVVTKKNVTVESARVRIQRWFEDRKINNKLSHKFYKASTPAYFYCELRRYGISSPRELLGPEFVEFRDKLGIDEEMAAILFISRQEILAKKGVDIFLPINEVENQDYKKKE